MMGEGKKKKCERTATRTLPVTALVTVDFRFRRLMESPRLCIGTSDPLLLM